MSPQRGDKRDRTMGMNNILYFNLIRTMDRKIERDMEETVDVVKNGYRCIREKCYLGRMRVCGRVGKKWRKECDWDLRGRVRCEDGGAYGKRRW